MEEPPPAAEAFSFFETGRLIDEDLELVAPEQHWIDAVLSSIAHPTTQYVGDEATGLTRERLLRFLRAAPLGREPGNPAHGRVPVYHFWMRLRPQFHPIVPIAGSISLRIGMTDDILLYFGHIGYGVYPPARGHHLAERACRLLLPLAARHGLRVLWITTDPDNHASRRTCQRLGAELIDVVDVPPGHPLHARGQIRKCRYRLPL